MENSSVTNSYRFPVYGLLLVILFAFSGYGFKPTVLSSEKQVIEPLFSYLVDRHDSMSVKQVLGAGDKFQKSAGKAPNFGFTEYTYWLKFEFIKQAASDNTRKWVLEYGYPFLDYVTMYTVISNRVAARQISGRMYPFEQRKFKHRNLVFELDFPDNVPVVLLFRIRTGSNMSLPVTVSQMEHFFLQNRNDQIAMGIFYGAVLVMILYNLLLLFSLRDLTYFYYVLFLVSIAIVQMGLHGLSYEYLWPDAPWWNSKSFLFFTAFAVFSICLFEKSFFFTKRNSPVLHMVLTVLQILLLVLAFCSFLFKYAIMVKLVSFFAAVSSFVIISSAFRSLRTSYKAARFFLVAWLAFLLGGTLLVIRNFGVLPHSFLTINGMQIGIILLIAFLSLALSERISYMRKEHDHLVMLQKELGIARSVQANILPTGKYLQTVKGYDIDVKFMPMNKSVSGDYYNITSLANGGLSLTVADASGHGMQAALTTMQIDLICRESQIEANAADRLQYMNTNWLDKKLSDNFFTCFTVDIIEDRAEFASAGHPLQYLLRQQSGEIHKLGGRGRIIGFSENSRFELCETAIQPGDLLLLFSDGVLEEFNQEGEEYGEARLEQCLYKLLETGSMLTAAAVNRYILLDLEMFRQGEPVNDDITLLTVAIKQNEVTLEDIYE